MKDYQMKDYQKEYRKNITDEQKQKYKEARKDYIITDEKKQKPKDYQKQYRENKTDEQKQKMKDYQKDTEKIWQMKKTKI